MYLDSVTFPVDPTDMWLEARTPKNLPAGNCDVHSRYTTGTVSCASPDK